MLHTSKTRLERSRTSRRVVSDTLFGTQPIAGIRAATSMAKGAGETAINTANTYGTEASDIGSMLVPTLEREASNPQGFNPTDLNAMLVAGQQGAGGATGAIQGQANLTAARTRNSGALSAVLDEAARARSKASSESALNVQGMNANLKEKQRQAGLQGLESVRGGDVNAQLKAEGLVPEDINAWTNASKAGWLQNTMGVLGTLSGMASSAGKMAGLPG